MNRNLKKKIATALFLDRLLEYETLDTFGEYGDGR